MQPFVEGEGKGVVDGAVAGDAIAAGKLRRRDEDTEMCLSGGCGFRIVAGMLPTFIDDF